jgi:hypothetical protein
VSRAVHAGRPGTATVQRPPAGPGPWFHAGADRSPAGELTLIRELDLHRPLPSFRGGEWTRVWLLVRLGDRIVGELLLRVPEKGLTSAAIGAAVAARFGAEARPAGGRARDAQPRSRSRGRIRSA